MRAICDAWHDDPGTGIALLQDLIDGREATHTACAEIAGITYRSLTRMLAGQQPVSYQACRLLTLEP